jgi:2-polyprenyl-3-methyl-5-hydroxy-6-metoxy-1,4-benzoquinol methylase
MFREAGTPMAIYDPFFAPDPSVLQREYDFITMTEVAEHLRAPGEIFRQLTGMLKPGGWLGVVTQRVIDQSAFRRWRYTQDPTHIAFYSEATFVWLSEHLGCDLTVISKDTVLLQK